MTLIEAISGTWTVMNGAELSDVALDMLVSDLETYPFESVLVGLSRMRTECTRATLAAVIERIPGGHPSPDEAWSLVAKALNDEAVTVLMTDEIGTAFCAALQLADDPIAARMAFLDVYRRVKAEAQQKRLAPSWRVSLGHDPNGREGVVNEAVRKGLIGARQAQALLPEIVEPAAPVLALVEQQNIG